MIRKLSYNTLTPQEKRLLRKWAIAYGAMFLLMWYCMANFKSGPCTPNLDVLSWLLASVLSFTFLIASLVQLIRIRGREAVLTLLINLVGFTILLLIGVT